MEVFTISYINDLYYLLDANIIWNIIELLFVTSCISTIIFILTKNQNISILSSVPVFYIFSLLQYGVSNIVVLLIVFIIQGVIVFRMKNKVSRDSRKDHT